MSRGYPDYELSKCEMIINIAMFIFKIVYGHVARTTDCISGNVMANEIWIIIDSKFNQRNVCLLSNSIKLLKPLKWPRMIQTRDSQHSIWTNRTIRNRLIQFLIYHHEHRRSRDCITSYQIYPTITGPGRASGIQGYTCTAISPICMWTCIYYCSDQSCGGNHIWNQTTLTVW